MFDWNLYDTGEAYSERYAFKYDSNSGKLTKTDYLIIKDDWHVIYADFGAEAAVIVYNCSLYIPYALNMREDQIHIFTKK